MRFGGCKWFKNVNEWIASVAQKTQNTPICFNYIFWTGKFSILAKTLPDSPGASNRIEWSVCHTQPQQFKPAKLAWIDEPLIEQAVGTFLKQLYVCHKKIQNFLNKKNVILFCFTGKDRQGSWILLPSMIYRTNLLVSTTAQVS